MKPNLNMTKEQMILTGWVVAALLTLVLVVAFSPEAAQSNIVPDGSGQ